MSLETDVTAVLAADSTLTTAFTGGVISNAALKGMGITRKSYPTGFDATSGRLKPILLVKERVQIPTMAIRGEITQTASAVQAVEVWFYTDRENAVTVLETGLSRVYALLADKRVSNAKIVWREHHRNDRDYVLDGARVYWSVYDANGVING